MEHGGGIYYPFAIQQLLEKHGYNKAIWVNVYSIFNEEFPQTKTELYKVLEKYSDLEKENDTLKKYDNVKTEYLNTEEKEKINKIKNEINIKKAIEQHNLILDMLRRMEQNIDNLARQAQEEYTIEQKEERNISTVNILSKVFGLAYTILGAYFIWKYFELSTIIGTSFNDGGFLIIIGIGVIILLLLYLVSAYLGCIYLMNKWSTNIGIFSLVLGALGILYGPLMLFQMFSRGWMETELGYKDPSKSYAEVVNEHEKLQAAKKINGHL